MTQPTRWLLLGLSLLALAVLTASALTTYQSNKRLLSDFAVLRTLYEELRQERERSLQERERLMKGLAQAVHELERQHQGRPAQQVLAFDQARHFVEGKTLPVLTPTRPGWEGHDALCASCPVQPCTVAQQDTRLVYCQAGQAVAVYYGHAAVMGPGIAGMQLPDGTYYGERLRDIPESEEKGDVWPGK